MLSPGSMPAYADPNEILLEKILVEKFWPLFLKKTWLDVLIYSWNVFWVKEIEQLYSSLFQFFSPFNSYTNELLEINKYCNDPIPSALSLWKKDAKTILLHQLQNYFLPSLIDIQHKLDSLEWHIRINTIHSVILKHLECQEYKPDTNGVCFGISHAAMIAALLKEEIKYNDRLCILNQYTPELLPYFISLARVNKKLGLALSQEEELFLEIPAFFNRVMLIFNPIEYKDWFPVLHTPLFQNFLATWPLIKPEINEDQVQVEAFSGTYDETELIQHFQTFQRLVGNDPSINFRIGFSLGSSCHLISITYCAKEKTWLFSNAGYLELLDDERHLAKKIHTALSNNKWSIFSTKIYTSSIHENKIKPIAEAWKKNTAYQSIHTVSDKKARALDSDNGYWLHEATRIRETKIIKELLKKGANPHQENIYKYTAYGLAQGRGYNEVVQIFDEHEQARRTLIKKRPVGSVFFSGYKTPQKKQKQKEGGTRCQLGF